MSVMMASDRTAYLAQHRKTPPGFIDDRRSVYWVDKVPPAPPTEHKLTKRQQELAQSKQRHHGFVPDRPSPMWKIKPAALNYPEIKRLKTLSQPKPVHPGWMAMRSPFTVVKESCLKAKPTPRLAKLAQPKYSDPLLIKSNSSWDWGVWKSDINKPSLTHVASARLEQLSEAKVPPKDFQDNRYVVWSVSKAAINTQPTTRQQQLARPKTRIALDQDYDPYRVTFAARNAVASPRVGELSHAIPRKIRQKKAV